MYAYPEIWGNIFAFFVRKIGDCSHVQSVFRVVILRVTTVQLAYSETLHFVSLY